VAVIAVAFAPGYARVSRSLVLTLKERPFVEVQRSLGSRTARILGYHVVPNMIAPLVVLVAMDIPGAIATEAGMSFLGLGVQPPTADWGVILSDGFEVVRTSPWAVIWASLILMVATLGFTVLGEALRDLLDPRLAAVTSHRRRARRGAV
jgi:peptide/nickel transport system permease protein